MLSTGLRKSIRAVALFEAFKGAVVLAAGFGLLQLLHKNIHQIVFEFISRIHLNPAQKYPRIFLELADHITDQNLWLFAGLALTYSILRFIEGYGLWNQRTWAEWFAAVSAGIYLPFEVYEIYVKLSGVKLLALAANAIVIGIAAWALLQRKRKAPLH